MTDMKKEINFIGSKTTVLCVLNKMDFRYRKCNDGSKFLLECPDIAPLLKQGYWLCSVSLESVPNKEL